MTLCRPPPLRVWKGQPVLSCPAALVGTPSVHGGFHTQDVGAWLQRGGEGDQKAHLGPGFVTGATAQSLCWSRIPVFFLPGTHTHAQTRTHAHTHCTLRRRNTLRIRMCTHPHLFLFFFFFLQNRHLPGKAQPEGQRPRAWEKVKFNLSPPTTPPTPREL